MTYLLDNESRHISKRRTECGVKEPEEHGAENSKGLVVDQTLGALTVKREYHKRVDEDKGEPVGPFYISMVSSPKIAPEGAKEIEMLKAPELRDTEGVLKFLLFEILLVLLIVVVNGIFPNMKAH